MLGAIIGDIVGSRFEFDNTKTETFDLFAPSCGFTDDTICTVAVADAIMNGKNYETSVLEWCRRFPCPKGGYGGSFANWIRSSSPQPYGSYGNGSAMRVSPVGWLFDDLQKVSDEAAQTAQITHSHPEGIKGAVTIAACVFMLRSGATKADIKAYAEQQYTLPQYVPFSNPFNQSCMNAVPVSLACFLASTSFEDAIRKAVIVGGDSDTIGAITGSLAEAHYGIPASIKQTALDYLPSEQKSIVSQFYKIVCER